MGFCFKIGCGLGFAAALCAAGLPDAARFGQERIATVVRASPRTGKLVRIVLRDPSTPAPPPDRPSFSAAVERIAAEHSLPPELLHSVIRVESDYNPRAISPKGALGLMQLIPATARRFGVADAFNPEENIRGGAAYLRYLLDLYGGNYTLALAAYNAGEAAVARYGDVPPFPETRNYVNSVGKRLAAQAPRPVSPPVSAPEAKPADPAPAGPSHIREIVEADGSVRYVSR
jgi:soluble lytic murein transglycosylase-like protein